MVDGFQKHGRAVVIQHPHGFGVGYQPAGTDPEEETAFRHVIDHGDFGRDDRGVVDGQVDGSRSQLNPTSLTQQPGDKYERRGNVFGAVGNVFADEAFREF